MSRNLLSFSDLRSTQLRGFEHLASKRRSNLFMPPGMGKTATVLQVLVDTLDLPAWVVAPKRVMLEVWAQEAELWRETKGLRVSLITGTPKQRLVAMRRPADLYVINPENMPWALENQPRRPRAVIVDEASMLRGLRLEQGTKTSAAIARMALAVDRYHGMTGTPTTNGLDSLWGITYPVDSGDRLGSSYGAFFQRWFDYDPYTFLTTTRGNAFDEITSRIKDISPSILPPFELEVPIELEVKVTLPMAAQLVYEQMASTMVIEDYNIEAPTSAAKVNKLLQISAGAVYGEEKKVHHVHDAKLDALERIAGEHSGPLLVTYRFIPERDAIMGRFKGARVLDETAVADWNAGKVPMLLVHAKSGGHGLNLQHGGNAIVHTTLQHDFELFDQVNARIGPMRQMQSGYKRPVFQYYLLASPIDRAVLRCLREKCTLQDAVLKELALV